jgi:DNA-binding GntR family transcriptional regulator
METPPRSSGDLADGQRRPDPHGRGSEPLPKRPPASAADYVADNVKVEILRGRFELGSKLDQQGLAEEFGVSTIPVREALRKLAAEGLVRLHPRRGAFVASVSDEELSEINRIRAALEDQATSLAAPRLRPQELTELRQLNRRMADSVHDSANTTWDTLNRRWHFVIYESSGSPLLLQLIGILWDRYTLYRMMNYAKPESRLKSVAEHDAVLKCLEGSDPTGAARAMRRHISRGVVDARNTMESRRRAGDDEPNRRQRSV